MDSALRSLLPLALALAVVGCGDDSASGEPTGAAPVELAPEPAATPGPAHLRRLTTAQYEASARFVLGDGLSMPSTLEPDGEALGFASAAAAIDALSALGVERYEDASYFLADQRIAAGLDGWLPCVPASASDTSCASESLEVLGQRAWRRPLTSDELAVLVGLWGDVATATDPDTGWRYTLAALLQSPHFLYRVELGEGGVLTATEWATRVSFLLFAAPPDDALLAAAVAGELDTAEGRATKVDEMLADGRLDAGIRAFVTEWFHLEKLDALDKDPLLFPHAHPELGPAAREETLQLAAWLGTSDRDWRELLTSSVSFVDPRLAALYELQAPVLDGFGQVQLPDERRGILGHASVLSVHSHSTRTSATGRGLFVRTALLCQAVPEPPADVDTSLPEPDTTSPTLRDRLTTHLEDPTCSVCHLITDPIGLGLENYDAVGRWREIEKGANIDPSGELDGSAFDDAIGLGEAIAEHPSLPPCWSERWWVYATGAPPAAYVTTDWLAERFTGSEHRLRELLRTMATSEAFRAVEAP